MKQAGNGGLQGDPLSTLVRVGGHSALCDVHVTRLLPPVTRRHSAYRSLLRSLLALSCTLMSYSFFLSVV
jgi:hypothetical protein